MGMCYKRRKAVLPFIINFPFFLLQRQEKIQTLYFLTWCHLVCDAQLFWNITKCSNQMQEWILLLQPLNSKTWEESFHGEFTWQCACACYTLHFNAFQKIKSTLKKLKSHCKKKSLISTIYFSTIYVYILF